MKTKTNRLNIEAQNYLVSALQAEAEGVHGAAELFLRRAEWLERNAHLYNEFQAENLWVNILLRRVPSFPEPESDYDRKAA